MEQETTVVTPWKNNHRLNDESPKSSNKYSPANALLNEHSRTYKHKDSRTHSNTLVCTNTNHRNRG